MTLTDEVILKIPLCLNMLKMQYLLYSISNCNLLYISKKTLSVHCSEITLSVISLCFLHLRTERQADMFVGFNLK